MPLADDPSSNAAEATEQSVHEVIFETLDHVGGTLLGTAAGDARGAGYGLGPPIPHDQPGAMIDGGRLLMRNRRHAKGEER